MKKLLLLLSCAAALAPLFGATDMGVIVTSKNIGDFASVVNGNGGTATITIADTNGTDHAVTVYNKSQIDTALAGKASASDVTALKNRATALETATNNLTTAVAAAQATANGALSRADGGTVQGALECTGGAMFKSGVGIEGSFGVSFGSEYGAGGWQIYKDGSAVILSVNNGVTTSLLIFPAADGTLARVEDIPTAFSYTVITNAPWITSYTETDPTVPSWAKASSKPSYNFSEIGSKPTTLSGYGITDASIANGTITLGANSITPLTSYTETDPTALKPSQLTVDGTAMTTSSPAVELGSYYIATVDGKPHLFAR